MVDSIEKKATQKRGDSNIFPYFKSFEHLSSCYHNPTLHPLLELQNPGGLGRMPWHQLVYQLRVNPEARSFAAYSLKAAASKAAAAAAAAASGSSPACAVAWINNRQLGRLYFR